MDPSISRPDRLHGYWEVFLVVLSFRKATADENCVRHPEMQKNPLGDQFCQTNSLESSIVIIEISFRNPNVERYTLLMQHNRFWNLWTTPSHLP